VRIVLDTNIWISALISPNGTTAHLLAQLTGHTLLTSPEILVEIQRVLGYPHIARRYGVTELAAQVYVDNIRAASLVVQSMPSPLTPLLAADPADDKFLLCALAGRADCIISGDRHLKNLGSYGGIPILPPADFLAFLHSGEGMA